MWKPSKLELILGALIILLACSVIYHWYVQPIYHVTESEKRESEERLQKHREIENSPNYRPGYASDTVVSNLEQALEKNPYNVDARIELLDVYSNRIGHVANERPNIEKRIIEGMKLDLPPDKKQRLMNKALSYQGMMSEEAQLEAFGTTDTQKIMQKIADLNPTSDQALRRRFKLLENKVRANENDARLYLKTTREVLSEKYGSKNDIPKKTRLYLDYLEARLHEKAQEYDKAASIYTKIYNYLNTLPEKERAAGLPKGNLPFSDIRERVLKSYQKTRNANGIRQIINQIYGEDYDGRMLNFHEKLLEESKSWEQ